MEPRGRGVLDRPVKPDDDIQFHFALQQIRKNTPCESGDGISAGFSVLVPLAIQGSRAGRARSARISREETCVN
jgi:hypothetical protein